MEYGMFTKAGNAAVARIIDDVRSLSIETSNKELYAYLNKRMKVVSARHPEIYDSDVRDAIISILERRLHRELTMYF